MKTRIRENGVKAIIYVLLFVFLIVRGFFLEETPEKSSVQASQISSPIPSR